MSNVLKNNKDKYQLVIGIDFGTSRSGFAYGWMNEQTDTKREINLCTQWIEQPYRYVKTSTLLLYSPKQEIKWGYEAKIKLTELDSEDFARGYHLFERFKMKLYKEEEYYKNNGQEFLVLDLISDYLRKLKDYALTHIFGTTINSLSDEKILWCLTIPAMWTNQSKDSMVNAAIKAGLIKNRSEYGVRLVFVLEPEAAAIYCQRKDAVSPVPALNIGTRFMVVDAGGGTVDITVHEVSSQGLEAVTKNFGDAHGSTYVDNDFHDYLEELLTSKVVKKLEKENPKDYADLLNEWEEIKCSFNESQIQRNAPSRIPIPTSISKNWTDDVFENLSRQQNGDRYNIVISCDLMKKIFEGTLGKLVETVNEAFSELDERGGKCDYIFLVGEFSHSPLLQNRIREEYETQENKKRVQKVVIPNEPGSAILWGAVAYGIDPTIIRSRSSSLTYGIEVRMPFESLDEKLGRKRVWNQWQNQDYCEVRFSIFARAGEIVEVGKKVTNVYNPTEPDETRMLITIYSTTKEYIRYVDDPSVSLEGQMEISMPDTSGGINRKIEVTMDFSEALITATAKDLASGNISHVEVRFSFTHYSQPKWKA